MLTLIERARQHLSQPSDNMGWNWTTEALVEELTEKCQRPGLPPRLLLVYTSIKDDLLERVQTAV